ncbi:MAG: DUF6268 family outer membrane beta-barrel protein [Desulfonatronovibrio sp.]
MKKTVSIFFLFTLLFSGIQVHAGPAGSSRASIKAEYEHSFSARISGTSARISSDKYQITGKYSCFTLHYDYQNYSWDNAEDTAFEADGKNPWTDLHNISLGARKNFFLSKRWMLNLSGRVGGSFEKEVSDSFWGRADFSFIRNFDNGWSAGLGLAGFYHPVRGTVLPVVMLSYTPASRQGFSGRLGFPETSLTYNFQDNLAAKAYLGYTARIYRLKNNSSVHPKGYFSDQAFKLGLDLEIQPIRNLSLSFGPYYLIERELKTFNSNYKDKHKEEVKNTPGIKLDISWNF